MPDHVLQPCEVGVAHRRDAVLPAYVLLELVTAPILQVERRVGQDEVELLALVLVVEERVCIVTQISLDAADREIHRGELPG